MWAPTSQQLNPSHAGSPPISPFSGMNPPTLARERFQLLRAHVIRLGPHVKSRIILLF